MEDVPDIGIVDIGAGDVLVDIGADAVESVPVDGVADPPVWPGVEPVWPGVEDVLGTFVESAVGAVGSGGVAVGAAGATGTVGVSAACAKALGAEASIAAMALASAQRCKLVRVDMGGKAPFY